MCTPTAISSAGVKNLQQNPPEDVVLIGTARFVDKVYVAISSIILPHFLATVPLAIKGIVVLVQ